MTKIKQKLTLGGLSVLSVVALAAAPAWAAHGSSSGSGGTDDTIVASTTSTETETETEHGTTTVTSQSLKAEAHTLLQQKRQGHTGSTAEHKQKACQAHQKEIDHRSKNYATAAQRHLGVFNAIFTKVQAFHDSKQLNVDSYDSLVAAANAKQTAAQSAVDTLKALDVSIDCNGSDPATTVATLKTAVKDARVALQDYRTAIKNLVVALKGASTSTNSGNSADGGAQ